MTSPKNGDVAWMRDDKGHDHLLVFEAPLDSWRVVFYGDRPLNQKQREHLLAAIRNPAPHAPRKT